jgi:hypothetical protein
MSSPSSAPGVGLAFVMSHTRIHTRRGTLRHSPGVWKGARWFHGLLLVAAGRQSANSGMESLERPRVSKVPVVQEHEIQNFRTLPMLSNLRTRRRVRAVLVAPSRLGGTHVDPA